MLKRIATRSIHDGRLKSDPGQLFYEVHLSDAVPEDGSGEDWARAKLRSSRGNATGIALMTATLTLKRRELTREFLPKNATIGFLVNPDIRLASGNRRRCPGQSLVAKARNPNDLEPAFTQLVSAQVGAVLISNDALFVSQRMQLVALAKRHSLPATYEFREYPAVGGLMSYGPKLIGIFQKAGTYAALILKGAKPSDLPIQQPTVFELVINSATARSWASKFLPLSSSAPTK